MSSRFQGFANDARVTLAASQGGVARGPLTVSAWKKTAEETFTDGTFKIYVNQTPTAGGSVPANPSIHQGWEIADGGLVEGVAPLPLMVIVDDFDGFAVNDPRQLWVEVDYGERYEAQYHDPINFPAELTMPQGSTLGRYPGFATGHSLRGRNMAGAAVLTPENATVENTVTATVSDGDQTRQVSFRARLYHPDIYYTDLNKSVCYPTAPEANRRGIVYFSRDGDFTGCLAQSPQTSTQAGVYWYHKPDGVISEWSWVGDQSAHGGPVFPFTMNQTGCIDVRLKGGERWLISKAMTPPGNNSRITSWGTGQAILDPTLMREWTGRPAIIDINGWGEEGLRLDNLHFECSDAVITDPERREWWNILNYTDKSGTFTENSGTNTQTLNGEVISNGNGVYCQILGDNGTQLIVRQVVDNADPNADAAQPAAFADGDTLTGQRSGATCTFVVSLSRQDRTVRWPAVGISIADMANVCIDRCRISNSSVGVSIGRGSVISDTWIRNWWDYGHFEGGSFRWNATVGCAFTQPLGYVSEPRDFSAPGGQNIAVAGAREEWNVPNEGNPTLPQENSIAHACHRSAVNLMSAYYFNKIHSYGGHGADHQPVFRLCTNGQEGPDQFYCVIFGNGISGGALSLNFGTAVGGVYPYTARSVLIEANHLLGQDTSVGALVAVHYSGTTVRNNLMEYPAGIDFGEAGCGFIGMSSRNYAVNPDVAPKDIVIEFNTFVFNSDNGLIAKNVGAQGNNLRGLPVTWTNNAYAIAQTKVGSISANVAAINDNPATDFTADWRPLPEANAYRTATGTFPAKDATGADRPDSGVSRGAFEPV